MSFISFSIKNVTLNPTNCKALLPHPVYFEMRFKSSSCRYYEHMNVHTSKLKRNNENAWIKPRVTTCLLRRKLIVWNVFFLSWLEIKKFNMSGPVDKKKGLEVKVDISRATDIRRTLNSNRDWTCKSLTIFT